ncbi:hypothetical protein ACSLOZ_29750, partial [Escherichia coli]
TDRNNGSGRTHFDLVYRERTAGQQLLVLIAHFQRQRVTLARIKADSALARHNEYQQNGSLTLTGTPQLTAGNKIELVGFGQ